jgi:hypothetical protein
MSRTVTSAHPVHQHAHISGFRFSLSFCFVSSVSSWHMSFLSTTEKKIIFLKKRLPGVGSEPGSSQFHLFSHFSPLYR